MRYLACFALAVLIGTLATSAMAELDPIGAVPKKQPDCTMSGTSCGNMNADCDTLGGSCTTAPSTPTRRWHDGTTAVAADGCGCLI